MIIYWTLASFKEFETQATNSWPQAQLRLLGRSRVFDVDLCLGLG